MFGLSLFPIFLKCLFYKGKPYLTLRLSMKCLLLFNPTLSTSIRYFPTSLTQPSLIQMLSDHRLYKTWTSCMDTVMTPTGSWRAVVKLSGQLPSVAILAVPPPSNSWLIQPENILWGITPTAMPNWTRGRPMAKVGMYPLRPVPLHGPQPGLHFDRDCILHSWLP